MEIVVSSGEQARGNYPPRLYPVGKSNLESKLINHNCKMADLPEVRETLGIDAWEAMKGYPIGIVAKLSDSGVTWSGRIVHYLLCRQLKIHKKELWFLVGGQPIRFGLNEFRHITGLNTDLLPTEPFEPAADYRSFLSQLNVPNGEGPTYDELRAGLPKCRIWDLRERKWLGLLILLCAGIYGLHHNSRIPFESAKRVFDDEAMKAYPWGRIAFKTLVDSVKMLNPVKSSYTLSGFVYVLQAWAYESVTIFGEKAGKQINNADVPLVKWGGHRTRSTFDALLADDIEAYKEVRVMNMVVPADVRELHHFWPDQEEDPSLDNLIQDIFEGKLVKGFWDDVNRKKHKAVVHANESPAKKLKVDNGSKLYTAAGEPGDGAAHIKKKKDKKIIVSEEDDVQEEVSVRTLINMVFNLKSRLEMVETNMTDISSKQAKLIGDIVQDRIDKRFSPAISDLSNRIVTLEDDVNQVKLSMNTQKSNSSNNDVLHTQSKEVPEKPQRLPRSTPSKNSEDKVKDSGLPGVKKNLQNEHDRSTVHKQIKSDKNVKPADKNPRDRPATRLSVRESIPLPKSAEGKQKQQIQGEKKKKGRIGNGKNKKKLSEIVSPERRGVSVEILTKDDNIVAEEGDKDERDVTDQVIAEVIATIPESDDDAEDKIRNDLIKASRTESVSLSLHGSELNPQAAAQQILFPYIGSDGLTCMRKNCEPSDGIYDPLAPVDPVKLNKLLAYLSQSDIDSDTAAFYSVIMCERKDWLNKEYGWLEDNHVSAFLRVLRNRFSRDPCPFHCKRIAFIDPWFVTVWVQEYENFKINPKQFKFKDSVFEKLATGLLPSDQQTKMKWIEDVDHLYIIPQTGGNHWVALDVDLRKRHIECYDSIVRHVTPESEEKMLNYCRPFFEMIPAMLNDILPATTREPTDEQFTFRRRNPSRVPQNLNPGDCGVYALKFVECLALGVTFHGICDENMHAIRLKIASDIYDEAPDIFAQFS